MKVFFNSLGCDKNLCDAEHMLSLLSAEGLSITDDEGEDMPMYQSNIDILNELNSLRAENKRLKAQLKDLREFKENVEKSNKELLEEFEKALNESPLNPDKLEESIDAVCSRTLCSRKEALDNLAQNDYNVDKTITFINWSKLNVPSVIL